MKVKTVLASYALIIISLFSDYAFSQAQPFRVAINVGGEDALKSRVFSYLSREVRSISDVKVVSMSENPHWVLYVNTLEIGNGDRSYGVAMSTAILQTFNNASVTNLFKEDFKEIGESVTSGLYRFENLILQSGTEEHIRANCANIIAELDAQQIESARKNIRLLEKMTNDSSK